MKTRQLNNGVFPPFPRERWEDPVVFPILQGVWSHETALDIHELSDVMPSKMHMTVPFSFRRRKELPKLLRLYKDNLEDSDVEQRQGYRVTTPLRTIIDCVSSGTVADNFIAQAINQALSRGLFLENELEDIKQTEFETYQKIKRVMK